jgi:ABC-type Fe3+-hydroxamate transport system substrate-binding protein
MKFRQKFILAVSLAVFVFVGVPASSVLEVHAAQKSGGARTVVDMAGNEVTVPAEIKNVIITSWGEAFGILIALGQLDHINGMSDTSRYPWIRHTFPQVLQIPDYGSFDNVNVEEILKANPDLVIVPYTAQKSTEKMRQLGLPVYVNKVEDTDEYHDKELRAFAELFGVPEKANDLLEYKAGLRALVAERVKGIQENEKKKVYIMRRTILEKHNNDWSSGQAVELAGGINVARDTDKGFETNAESLLAWAPEYIFQVIAVEDNNEYYNKELKDDPIFSNIPAVKTGDTYSFPVGINYWYMGSEGGLAPLLIGKVLYPERFKDINIRDEANKFYKKFLGLDLDDESYEIMLRGFNGAKSLRGL